MIINIRNLPQGSYKPIQPKTNTLNVGSLPKKLTVEQLRKEQAQAEAEAKKSTTRRFFGELANNFLSPFTRTAATAYNVVSGTVKAAQGDYVGANQELSKTRDLNILGADVKPLELKGNNQASKLSPASILPTFQSSLDVANEGVNAGLSLVGAKAPKALTKLGEKFIPKLAERAAAKAAKEMETLAGVITQGKIKDIPAASQALSSIETKGIKTFTDLKEALGAKISAVSNKLDDTLSLWKGNVPLKNLGTKIKVGSETISHNYVDDAIKQLEEYYTKTNDVGGVAEMKIFRKIAETEGVTVRDLNNLAKRHGVDLEAFNANGELVSGLSKQAAENTRKGVKAIARKLFGNKIYDVADEQLSNLLRTQKLITKVEENVNTLNQKILKRNIFQKLGYSAAQIADKFTGGFVKGAVEGLLPRGRGFKTLNALDLEKMLQKNLSKLRELNSSKLGEADIITKLEQFMRGQYR